MIRKDKRSSFGGKLGDEFNEIWSAITANQIIPANGMEVKQTSTGTVLAPAKSSSGDVFVVGGGSSSSKIIETTIERYTPSYNGSYASLSSSQPSSSPWYDHQEAFIIDGLGRIIATPIISNIGPNPPVGRFGINLNDLFFYNSSYFGYAGWRWPKGWAIRNHGMGGHWGLLDPYTYGETIFAIQLDSPVEVPAGENIGGLYSGHQGFSRYDNNAGYLMWADYLDLNHLRRGWYPYQ